MKKYIISLFFLLSFSLSFALVVTVNKDSPTTSINYHSIQDAIDSNPFATSHDSIMIVQVYPPTDGSFHDGRVSIYDPEIAYTISGIGEVILDVEDSQFSIVGGRPIYPKVTLGNLKFITTTGTENLISIVKRNVSIIDCDFLNYEYNIAVNGVYCTYNDNYDTGNNTILNYDSDVSYLFDFNDNVFRDKSVKRGIYAESERKEATYVSYINGNNFNNMFYGVEMKDNGHFELFSNIFKNDLIYEQTFGVLIGTNTWDDSAYQGDNTLAGNFFYDTYDAASISTYLPRNNFLASNEIWDSKYGITVNSYRENVTSVKNNLIVLDSYSSSRNKYAMNFNSHCGSGINIVFNTFVGESGDYGIKLDGVPGNAVQDVLVGSVIANILWNFHIAAYISDDVTGPNNLGVDLAFNCYLESIVGDFYDPHDNFTENPLFVSTTHPRNYHLQDNSPCLNVMLDFDGDGILAEYLDDTDEFGNLGSIGYFDDPEKEYDTKMLRSNRYNWIGFPRLEASTEAIPNVINEDNLYDDVEFIKESEGNYYAPEEEWSQPDFSLDQTSGYKFYPSSTGRFVELRVDGEVINPNTPITLVAGQKNFLCFNVPVQISFDEVFNDGNANHFSKIKQIRADNFHYIGRETRDVNNNSAPVPSSRIRNFDYGKAYEIEVEQSFNLPNGWFIPEDRTSKEPVKDAEQFDVAYKADYETMDIIDIQEGVEEVGVYEGEECIGSAVVENNQAQVLVFSERSNRDEVPFTIEFYTGSRNMVKANYQVYDNNLATFIDKPVMARQQKYSLVRIKKEDVVANKVMNLDAGFIYPNPFTKSNSRAGVSISYSITKDAKVSASVYNIKGQKVAEVFTGNMDSGKHTIFWNGTSTEGNQVASGVYFMKVKAGEKSVTRKFVIMK